MEEVFVLELPLLVEKYQADILNKRYEQLRQLYNYVQGKLLRQYRYFEQMTEFQVCKTFKEKRDFLRSHPFHINGILGSNKALLDITFDDYGINGFVTKLGLKSISNEKTYADIGINSSILAIIIKSSVTCAFFPILIFKVNSSSVANSCFTLVPNKEFFFNPTLSSIITALIPFLSKVLTVKTKCSAIPPVSPSYIIG